MRQRTDVIYIYDGTFDGFLCCIHEYYYSSFNPVEIICEDEIEPSLYQFVTIETDPYKAQKVKTAIENKISLYTVRFLQECFLSCQKRTEIHMLWFVVKGFKKGNDIYRYVSDEDVDFILKANRNIKKEKHLYLGIVRFYKSGEDYIAVIKPKNRIVPLLANHFIQRFANQNFMIYDAANKQALIYSKNVAQMVKAENIELPEMNEDERNIQKLWKLFYDTIAIKERYNPRCRMNFMPKRTWDLLPEMQNYD
ncbi:MAG: TIGR03915 family putative DNA repair protein [Oscillospiraceae bacterium]|nr:TIGR03915 family putative DNA repair protein [Oscillospiraceae bacterium]